MELRLTSPAFEAGDTIPAKYTCEGANVSPPLEWGEASDEIESLVLICDDPDAPGGIWSHWVLYDMPPNTTGLEEDIPPEANLPWGGVQGRNDFGDIGYGGPCPPQGSTHRYYFRLYALGVKLEISPGASRGQILDRIEDEIVEQSELVASFTRS